MLGGVLTILLESSQNNADEVRLVAKSFKTMASDFEKMANIIDERNVAIANSLEKVAHDLEEKVKNSRRKSIGNAYTAAAETIMNAIKKVKR